MIIYSNINKCRICKSEKIVSFLDLKKQPSSNALRKNLKFPEYKIPLKLLFCKICKTVQLSSTTNPKFLFNHYVWVTKTSKSANDYSKVFCDRLLKKTKKNNFILEIASNDGTFLKPFKKMKRKVMGIDPAKNIAKIANKEGIKTLPEFFSLNCAKKLVKKFNKVDIVFARNVIPHVKNIHSILQGMSFVLESSGTAAIEFHYSKIIQDELHYDSIYHEHIFYFTIKTLTNLCKKYGLYAFDIDRSPISGGSLVVYFKKNKINQSKKLKKMIEIENKKATNSLKTWKFFAKKSIKHAKDFKSIVSKLKSKNKIIAYGASARSSTILNFCELNNSIIPNVIDKNKIKKNKFTPGTNIKIIDYDEIIKKINLYDLVIILAWNFRDEIIKDLKKQGYKGKFLLPLPNKVQFK